MPQVTTELSGVLHYEISGAGPVVLLLHGFPENGTIWAGIVPALQNNFRVIIPDLPGVGGSDLSGSDSIEVMAKMLNTILENEHIDELVVVGHSMGGYVALAFANLFPIKVKGLSLVHSTPAADDDQKKENRSKAIAIIEKGGKEPFLKQLIPTLFATGFAETHKEVLRTQLDRAMTVVPDSLVNYYRAMMNRPPHIALIEQAMFPIQWIIGEADYLIPLDKILPLAHKAKINFVSLYEGVGHMSMLEQPARLSGDLIEFLNYCYSR
jgi:pimeloyl-ACP methyl ester carboxylesterase